MMEWFTVSPSGRVTGDTKVPVIMSYPDSKDREVEFQLNPSIPDPTDYDSPATPAQIKAVQDFWPHFPDNLTFTQCHATLCYRDYAIAFIDIFMPTREEKNYEMWLRIVATLVSHNEIVSKDVRRWSERRWRQSLDTARIKITKHYKDLCETCHQINNTMMEMSKPE
jgi:hypothetical protein